MVNNCFRSLIGSDIFGALLKEIEDVEYHANKSAYPVYNIIKTDTGYLLELALAGFKESELSIVLEKNLLKVSAKKSDETRNYLYQGISSRSFERVFTLDKDVEVSWAGFNDGILSVTLKKVIKEEDLPRTIQIKQQDKRAFLTE